MLRTKPKFAYCGLTIVMSNQSRFDKHELLSATGGWFLNDKCLKPEYNRYQCDIRLKEDKSPLLDGTKCVLLLGEPAMRAWTGKIDNTIGEVRGSVYIINGVPHISSYLPQDCLDIKDYESDLNPLANRGDGYEEDDEDGGDEKRKHGFTSRKNFGFWLIKDIERCKHILEYGVPKSPEVNYITYPRQELVEQILQNTKNNVLHFDIETDYEQQNMQCFSFGFNDSSTVYNIPCLLPDYSWAYTGLHKIYKSLAVAIRDNTLVAHNGHNFDFFVLGHKYRIPVGRKVFDTMIAHHRCTPAYEYVDTVNGRIKIIDLVGKENFHVWSWKNGKPYPAKVKRVFKTQDKTTIVRVHCWRKKFAGIEKFHIDCTPDHKFLLKGRWIEAKDLKQKDSLTRVNIIYNSNSYHTLNRWDMGYKGDRCVIYKAHRYIYECLKEAVPPDCEVHHKDENIFNNEPDNLECKWAFSHRSDHKIGIAQTKGLPAWNKGIGKKNSISKEDLETNYKSGMSQKDLGKLFHVDATEITNLFKKFGIKARTLKEAQTLRRQNEKNCKVISVEYLKQKEDTYCMDVEGTNCYSCNGVIIHNCWPDQEKSLGHLMSHLTWEPFHKDTDAPYSSLENARKKWEYCGRDVYGMKIGYNKLLEYAKTIPGLMDSINQAMSSIKPYLTTTLQGISYRQDILDKTLKENDRLMMQYHRMINILVGEASLPFIRGKSLAPLPSSNVQCCRYFHDLLGYPVVARGQETKTGDRNPSLGKKALYKLRLNHDNPVIDISLLYRELAKESGSLKFTPWKI